MVVTVSLLSVVPRPSEEAPGLASAIVPILCLTVVALGTVAALRIERGWATVLGIVLVSLASIAYAVSVEPVLMAEENSDTVVLSFPVIAASLMGVGRRSLTACILVCGLGFAVAESSALAVAAVSGRGVVFDIRSAACLVAIWMLLVVLWAARRNATREAAALGRASREEEGIAEEARLLGHASSLLHDTVLGDLHAVAMLAPGPIPEAYRAVIRRDIELLDRDDDLLLAPGADRLPGLVEERGATALAQALARIDARGLRVVMSGEPAALSRLAPDREKAIVGAIEQCLVNVAVHAGVSLAELAIVATGSEVTAMVSDSGRGFVVSHQGEDRLGLRLSVTDRMRGVGGSSTIWSTPGSGTSVLLAAPLGHA